MQSNIREKRILVTGGLGHIGSRLINSLGHDLTVVDDLSSQRYCSLFGEGRNINFWPKDFADLTKEQLSWFDCIIHLAAKTDAAGSFNDEDAVRKVNVDDTLAFIDRAALAGVKLFVFPSSTSVYGMATYRIGFEPIITESSPDSINPQSPYAESKIEAEQALRASGMPFVILRMGTIFGISPGMRFHTAVNKFCFQAALGQPLTIWEQNYHQKRPYLGINDAIRAFNTVVNIGLSDKPNSVIGEVFNSLTDNLTVDDIVAIISSYVKVKLDVMDTPLVNQHSYTVCRKKIERLGVEFGDSLDRHISQTLGLFSRIRPDST